MRVIPVMDLLGGLAVHARRGDRTQYRPVRSALAPNTADPVSLARAFRAAGFAEIYVADLDAIAGKGNHLRTVAAIVEAAGLNVMLDAGVRHAPDARSLLEAGAATIVAGTETLQHLVEVAALIEEFGPDRVIFSLDSYAGKIMTSDPQVSSCSPEAILAQVAAYGLRTALLLELRAVGSEAGPAFAMARRLKQAAPQVELMVGGGVRGEADLVNLQRVGVTTALVATALHSGRLSFVSAG